jgi:hypothetical protein
MKNTPNGQPTIQKAQLPTGSLPRRIQNRQPVDGETTIDNDEVKKQEEPIRKK